MPKPSKIKSYVLLNQDSTEGSIFTGHQPRQAALKAANRIGGTKEKPVEIRLRERGVKNKYHVFKAWKEIVPAPKNRPKWMPEKINKPFVLKIGIERIMKG